MDTSRLVAILWRKPCLYPQLTEFFQTEIKQIDQSRYTQPPAMCVCSMTKLAEALQRDRRMEMDIWGTPSEPVPTHKLLLSALRVSKTTSSEPHQLYQGTCTRFPHLQEHQVWTDCNSEGNFPASERIEGLWLTASSIPTSPLSEKRRENRSHILKKGLLAFLSFSSEHLWNGNNFSALHCLSASPLALPLPFRKWLREWGLILNRDHHFTSSVVSPLGSKALKASSFIPFLPHCENHWPKGL